jgi:diacylglycerol kinase (ATP)
LVYNPVAGRVPIRLFIQLADKALSKEGWSVEVIETRSGQHAAHLGKVAADEKYEAVFAAGGDGTIGQIASGLVGSQTALGVLPAGTSNVWAREMGLSIFSWTHWWALQENARLLAQAPIRAIDVGLCNGQPFLMWAGLGLDAMAIHQLEPRLRIEKYFNVPQFAAATIWSASTWHGLNLRLWVEDKKVVGHYLLALVNNIRHYMGGLANLSPQAYLDDGLLDLWLFSGDSLADAFRHAFDLWAGRHLTSDQARRIPFRHLHIEADAPFSIQMDGEPMLTSHQADITVLPRALRILMPTQALELLSRQTKRAAIGPTSV